MTTIFRNLLLLSLACCIAQGNPSFLTGQDQPWQSQFQDMLGDDEDDDRPVYKFKGDFTVEQGTKNGILNISLDIKKGWHAYPQTEVDGQTPTSLVVKPSKQFKVVGPFTPDQKPKKRMNEFGVLAEEFSGTVTWSAPIEFTGNIDHSTVEITTDISGQICKTSCIPVEESVKARFSKYTTSVGKYATEHITLTGSIDKTSVKPGGKLNLTIRAKIVPNWHIYRREDSKQDDVGPHPTIFTFAKTAGFKVTPPKPSKDPVQERSQIGWR